MERDTQSWVADLTERSDSALSALREVLLRNLRRGLGNRPRADDSFLEDCAQESLLRVLENLDQFSGRSHFVTWATTIALRVAYGQLRRSHWQDVSLSNLPPPTALSSLNGSTSRRPLAAQTIRQDLLDTLSAAIESELTDRQRTALLAELRGMPQDEIARQLGSSRNALYKLTHDARKKLKAHLEAAGFSAADVIAVPEM